MKKKHNFPLILGIFTLFFSAACNNNDTVITPPTISVTVVGEPEYQPGDTVQYKIVAAGTSSSLKTLIVSGVTSIKPAAGSAVSYTEPADLWNAADSTFAANTMSATLYYNFVIDPILTTGIGFDIGFTVVDQNNQYAYILQSITIPPLN